MIDKDMLRPPVNRAMRTLDRAFFKKSLPLAAARVFNNQHLAQCRNELVKSEDSLIMERLSPIRSDPDESLAKSGKKCLVLRPGIKHDDATTWSSTIQGLIKSDRISLIPYTLNLDYDYWDYHDIISSILPEEERDEVPSGFSVVGHVAHLNLREQYIPYKHLIAEVLVDKNPGVKTVINKIDDVGSENQYRTFNYEVLTGPDDLNVEVKEEECIFAFDYAKVYWNPRLHHEHKRLVSSFTTGDVVCDVMAGVGPFAVPAGKKNIFVWANDLNPDSHSALVTAIARNKVSSFVKSFNEDGHTFIRSATEKLYNMKRHEVNYYTKPKRSERKAAEWAGVWWQRNIFDHFIMNLPASATSFLPSFIGLYSHAGVLKSEKLPLIHVYCFSTKSDDNVAERIKICAEISKQLNYTMTPAAMEYGFENEILKDDEVEVVDVRDVAPNKRMFCATFRLPSEVAFRVVEQEEGRG